MKIGEVRQLIIPADMAYGEAGVPGTIPPNSPLVFDVQLISIDEKAPAQEASEVTEVTEEPETEEEIVE